MGVCAGSCAVFGCGCSALAGRSGVDSRAAEPADGFTIKVQLAPLGVLLQRPDRAQAVLSMLDSWDDPMHDYKSAGGQVRPHVIPWLRRLTSQHG